MATERLPMRTIREILRLKWLLQRSHRETARSLGDLAAFYRASGKPKKAAELEKRAAALRSARR